MISMLTTVYFALIATHGAFGAFAFGIGTSEVEHVLATQVCYFRGDVIQYDTHLHAAHT